MMKEYKILSFEEVKDYIWLTRDAWSRVRSAPKEEYIQALRREFTWPEGFLDQLQGKSLEEQMRCYRIVETSYHSRIAYGEITRENSHRFGSALENYSGLKALVVEDGILLGVCIKAWGASDFSYPWGVAAFPYQDICTYYASDDNGAGSNDREDNAYLCCVVPEEE